jgi:hypothetical protein
MLSLKENRNDYSELSPAQKVIREREEQRRMIRIKRMAKSV